MVTSLRPTTRTGASGSIMARGRRRVVAALLGLAIGLVGASPAAAEFAPSSAQRDALEDIERTSFAHYTLALTWHPGFCATRRQPPRECREPRLMAAADDGFVIHGLWPSRPQRLIEAGVSVAQWHREGCFVEDSRPRGGFCQAGPALALEPGLEEALDEAMPGRASCLDRYEFAKHAACLTLPEDDFFAAAVVLSDLVNASAFAEFVLAHQGREVGRNDLIQAFEAAFGRGTGRALSLQCGGRGNRLLTEARIGIDADRIDDFPAADSLVAIARGRCPRTIEIPAF